MKKNEKKLKIIFWLGISLILLAVFLFCAIFYGVIKSEISYLISTKNKSVKIVLDEESKDNNENNEDKIIPVDKEFSIIIPQLKINAKVFANVDPQNENEYGNKLKKGVAHAKGSGFPNDEQTIFIFAHSSSNFYQNNQFNTIFYLLRKLKAGDVFYLVYQNKLYTYKMIDSKIVEKEAVSYLEDNKNYDVILMTCWPPGTAYRRLLVMGERIR